MPIIPVEELDDVLAHFDEGYAKSHDEAYKRFEDFSVAPPENLPADPFSTEYTDIYVALYKKISGRDEYSVQNERCGLDVERGTVRPFPYFSRSLKLAAQHYTLIGKLLEIMDVPDGADILEFGFGWGNTTLALGMLGHNVTAVDIEPDFCEIVRRRAKLVDLDVEIINSDFLWIETTDRQFDAICFFESFHHCWDFTRLLTAMQRNVRPGGKIYFGAEPINTDFKVPWGVRLDGQSLFVARRFGWMELGFHNDFFSELLTRTGWLGRCVYPHFWVATRKGDPMIYLASSPQILSQVGHKSGALLYIDAPGTAEDRFYGLYGPYIELPRGTYRGEIRVTPSHPFEESVTIDISHSGGTIIAASRLVGYDEMKAGPITIDFTLMTRIETLEMRMLVPGGFKGTVEQVQFV